MSKTEVAKRAESAVATQSGTPAELLQMAITADLDVDKLERLLDMQERWEATQSRKAFFEALAKFQYSCPDILKLDSAHTSKYAKLPRIVKVIAPTLRECGLTYRFETQDDADKIIVTCIVTHCDGHSERSSMSASADNSGKKNPIQARASAVTYLQRYTLGGALGIVTMDEDNDGYGEAPAEVKVISKTQVKTIEGLLNKLPDTVRDSMLSAYGIGAVEELPEANYTKTLTALNKHVADGETVV